MQALHSMLKRITHSLCAAGIAINTILVMGYTVNDNIGMVMFSFVTGLCCWVGYFRTKEDQSVT